MDGEQAELQINGRFPNVALTRNGARELARWLEDYCGRALPRLCGVEGIASEYGVTRRTVEGWRRHAKFPRPVEVEGGGPIWELERVRDWVETHRMKPGPRVN